MRYFPRFREFFSLALGLFASVLSLCVVSRVTAILIIASMVTPIFPVVYEPSTGHFVKDAGRPLAAPPEKFVIQGEKRGWESFGARLSGLSSEVAGLFSTKDPQTADGRSQAPSSATDGQTDQPSESNTISSTDNEAKSDVGSTRKVLTEELTESETEPKTEETRLEPARMNQPASTVDFDFDGDGKADVGRWHPSTKEFKVAKSTGGNLTVTFSSATLSAKPAPADYDGDGTTDAAVFDSGAWYIKKSSDGNTSTISFGQAGDLPMSGDYRGNGADELAVWRPSTGYWYWREFGNSTSYNVEWGTAGDVPAPGDYDGDGKLDWTIYRPSSGYWWILYNSLAGYTAFPWGIAMDIPTVADYDGDGKSDPTVWRPTSGQWWYLKSSTSYATYGSPTWGNIGDQPVVGDFDDDDKADFTIFRPSTGKWHTWTSQSAYQGSELGIAGDTAIPSSYVKQVGSNISPDVINNERLKPRNATGRTDLFSQNFGWSRNLVSLPGRSGMDLNLGLSYNSLIWTKLDTSMLFDPDAQVGMGPGFHIGFPTIEPAYYNDTLDAWNYLMVTPGGAKVEFRQTVGAANVYETHDSSYAQLTTTGATDPSDPVDAITLVVVTTDGTQMFYDWISGAFRCTSIRDRNGNYISITYDSSDRGIATITDTLGRVVTFNYTDYNLTSITQTWKDTNGSGSNTTHTYATFSYVNKELQADFSSSLAVWGPVNASELKVLDKVTYDDGSFTKFYYNDYLQAYKIEEHAADSGGTAHVLNHVRVNLNTSGTGALPADQTDCPRFTKLFNFAENFNSGSETETTITRSTGQSYTSPAGGSAQTLTKIEVAMSGDPYNSISKTWYGESSWKDGLPIATEDWADGASGSERKRWTLTHYTQDYTDTSVTTNPRVTETKVGDGTNTKRTTIDYELYSSSTVAKFGLPSVVKVYDTDLTSVLKKVTTTYNFDSNLVARRIVGLPATVEVEGYNQLTSSSELVSKMTYAYDEGNFSDTSLVQNVTPTQHDSTNYGTGFSYRGNLTSTTRWDASVPSDGGAAITSSTKYNTAGSPVAKITPWDGSQTRTVRIGYADNFNSSPGVTTNAYPTVMTDPAGSSIGASGHSSTIKYRYDIGANVEAESPPPAGQTYGKKSKRVFDSVGRLEKDSVYVNSTEKSYTRYEYPTNGIQSKTYRPIVDADNDGNIAEDEVYTEGWFDGAGRVRQSRTEHPGSTGGWASTFVEYDILGRVKRQSVPTETNSSFSPTGDDSAGALWTHFKYDWMGRVVRKINTDGTDSPTLNDSDVIYSYAGCGCAGGLVTTIQGESTDAKDVSGTLQTDKRRYQKIYEDILGRTAKTEVWDLDGAGSAPYTTTETKYNGRGQVARSRKYAGDTSSSTYQDTTATYDGHGRVASSHVPEQDAGRSTVFTYNPDGSVLTMTDARGATTTHEYNVLGLVTEKSYTAPANSDYLFPEIKKVTKNSSSNLTITGQHFESSAEVLVFQTTNGYTENLATYSGSDITTGTSGGNQTLTFEMTETNVLSAFHSGHLWVQVINPTTGRGSRKNYHLLAPYNHPEWWLEMGLTDQSRPTETFSYDSLGNLTEMVDGSGETDFVYDSLSRITSETRTPSLTVPTPTTNYASGFYLSSYTIGYQYGTTGNLRKLTDPFSKETNYTYDKVGRTTNVAGTTFASQSTTISSKSYRAFGATKSTTYGTSLVMTQTFNSGLRTASFDLTRSGSTVLHKEYEYIPDGSLKYSEDGGGSGNKFDRLYTRDFAGRLTDAKSGAEARGQTPSPAGDRPYLQSFEYDRFNNVTELNSENWDQGAAPFPNHTYDSATNRETTTSGVVIPMPNHFYDADGREVGFYDWGGFRDKGSDASGQLVGQKVGPNTIYPPEGPNYTETYYNYYIRSTVLGGALINEIHLTRSLDPWSGVNTTLFGEQKTHVVVDGQTVATQRKASQEYDSMTWDHMDPSGATYASSAIVEGNFYGNRGAELDATGSNAGSAAPEPYNPWDPWQFPGFGSIADDRCSVDGIRGVYSLHQCFGMLANGSADIDFTRMDPFRLGQWGIMPSWNPYSGETYRPPDVPDGTIDGGTTSTQGNGSWSYLFIGAIGFQTQPWIDRQKILDDTIKRVEQRFKDHPDCLKLFKNMDPVKHMQGISISKSPADDGKFPRGELQAAVTDSPPFDANGVRPATGPITMNANSFFFSGDFQGKPLIPQVQPISSMYGLTLDEVRELMILHELWHVNDTTGSADDGKPGTEARGITTNVMLRRNCFPLPGQTEGSPIPGAVGLPPR